MWVLHIAKMFLSTFLSTFAVPEDVSFKGRYQMVCAFQFPLQPMEKTNFSPSTRVSPEGTENMKSTEEGVQSN